MKTSHKIIALLSLLSLIALVVVSGNEQNFAEGVVPKMVPVMVALIPVAIFGFATYGFVRFANRTRKARKG